MDVAVVGAGIGGAVLGLALGRRGWRVALVEREAVPPRFARPEILWGATPAALVPLGIGAAIRDEASVAIESVEARCASAPLIAITREDFTAASVRGFSTDPSLTRARITEAALATGRVEVQRGFEVNDLLRDGARVVGVSGKRGAEAISLEARLVVGDDGVHSVVRTKLAIPIALATFPIDFVTAAIRWPEALAPRTVHVRVDPAAFREGLPFAAFFPWPRGEGVLLVPLPSGRAERLLAGTADSFWRHLEGLAPFAASLREQLAFPRAFARVQRPFGHAERYVADGAAILGDAAHPMTPAGGQGANASIWDALALADVADAALRAGDATRERLLPYERLRHPINARSVAISSRVRLAFRMSRFVPLSIAVPPLARLVDRLAWPKRRVIRGFATTFVTPESVRAIG